MSKRPPCWRCTLSYCLPPAFCLSPCSSGPPSLLRHGQSTEAMASCWPSCGLALLAAQPVARAHESGGPFHCIRSAAASFGRGIRHRRTPGPASDRRGDLVGPEPAPRCAPGCNFPPRGPIRRRASAVAAPDRGRRPPCLGSPGAAPARDRSRVAHGRDAIPARLWNGLAPLVCLRRRGRGPFGRGDPVLGLSRAIWNGAHAAGRRAFAAGNAGAGPTSPWLRPTSSTLWRWGER